ncbi:MAG: hypothetical protein M0R17_04490 [Candidatus Omnitrophica bacterium]|jgi:hypothetical protein|nr:hypothetical protein [Candidatus Omnitrophota bacterium]
MKIEHKLNIKKDLHLFIFSQLNELRHWDLVPSDVRILAQLYNMDYDMVATGEVKKYEDRMNILFSVENKKKIMEELKMSYNTFNNSLTKLRKKDWISKDNTIDEKYLFNLGAKEFKFIIEFKDEA